MASRVTRLSTGEPTVLLLPPLFHDARIWGRFATGLAERVGLTVADWPGHGPGRPVLPASFSQVDEATRIVDLAGDHDVVIAAHKDAAAAVHLAQLGRARALVLIDPTPDDFLPEVAFDDLEQVPPSPLEDDEIEVMVKAIKQRDARALAALGASDYADQLSSQDCALLRAVFEDNAPVLFTGVLEYIEDRPPWPDALPDLRLPVLAIALASMSTGRVDPKQAIVRAIAARCRDGRVATFEAETDFPWLEHPDELVGIVLEFIRTSLGSA